VKPTHAGSVLHFLGCVFYITRKDVTKAPESMSGRIRSYSFWLETKTTSEKGGGAYVKRGPASLFAGSQGVGRSQFNACKT